MTLNLAPIINQCEDFVNKAIGIIEREPTAGEGMIVRLNGAQAQKKLKS